MTTYSWTPGVSADWNAPVDWEPFGVPNAATADAVINVSGNYTVTIASTESFLVDSLTFNSGSGGTLDLNGTLTLGGTLAEMTESSGAVNVAGTLSGGTLTLDGGTFEVENSGTATLSTVSTSAAADFEVQNGGVVTVTGGFTNGGDLALGGAGSLTIDGTLDNTGEVSVNGGSAPLTLTLGGLINASGASFSLSGSASYAATLAFSGGTGFTSNAGSFGLEYAAPLTLNNSFTNASTGTFELSDNTTLTVGGGFTNSGALDLVDSAALTVTGGLTNSGALDVDAGYYSGGGSSLTIDGTLDNTGTVQIGSASPYLSAPDTVTLGGLINASGASFSLFGTASYAATLAFSGGTGFTSNAGYFLLEYVAPFTLNSSFTNASTGTFSLYNSTVTVTGGFTNGGDLALGGAGSLTIDGTLDNTGEVSVNGGSAPLTLTLGGLINASGASFSLSGSASYAATLAFSGGTGFTSNAGSFGLEYAAPLTLNNSFTNASTGTFELSDNTTLTVGGGFTNSGALDLVDSAALTVGGGLTNSGALDVDAGYYSGGGSSLTIDGTLDNTGTVQIGSASPYLSAPDTVTLGGLINASGASFSLFGTASYAATLTIAGSAENAGIINISSFSTLDVSGGNAFTQTGGTTTVNGTFAAATIDINGGTLTFYTSNFTNTGTLEAADGGVIDFSAGGLTNLSGTTLTGGVYIVDAGSTLQVPNNTFIQTLAANLTLSGTGSVVESLDTATSVQVPLERTLSTIATGGTLNVTGGRSYTTANTITDAGALQINGGGTFTAGGLSVAGGAVASVGAGSSLDLSSPMSVSGTLINAGTVSGGGATAVTFGTTSTDRLILDPGAIFTGTVEGGGANTTLELAKGAGRGTLDALGTTFINFGTVVVDPGATWTVEALASALAGVTMTGSGGSDVLEMISAGTFSLGGVSNFPTIELANGNNTVSISAAAVNGDVLTGGSGTNTLMLTSAGTFSLGGVSNFATIELVPGNNTVTVTDTTLSGGAVTIEAGASGNETINVVDTVASKGKTLTYVAATGKDRFAGGFENDTVYVSATALAGDTLTGGSGTNTLVLTSAGEINLVPLSTFSTVDLSAGNNTVDASAAEASRDTLVGGSGSNALVLTTAGTVNLGGVSDFANVYLAAGTNTVTVTDTTLSGGSVAVHDGASGNNSVSAAGDTAASKGKILYYVTGSGSDSFTGGFENDTVYVSATAVGGDTLTGGSGSNALVLTNAGTFSLGGVSRFANIYLAAGNNAVTVTDTTLSGGSVAVHDGASGNNKVSAAGDTAASKGKILYYVAGIGPDSFTGGFENDTVNVSAAAVGGDTLTGGSGNNALVLTSAGTFSLGGVSKFGNVYLAAGNSTVTVTDTTLAGKSVAVRDGASGNKSVSAAGDTAASKGATLYFVTGSGADSFAGGFENDTVYVSATAVGGDTLTGGSGADVLVLTSAGSVDLGGVSRFTTVYLAAGTNTVTVTDTTLSGGAVTLRDVAGSNNTISAAGDMAASEGKTLYYIPGTGTDSFTGGFENDTIYMAAGPALGGDTFTGGSGTNAVVMTSAGTADLDGVSKFPNVYLTGGNNTVTVTDTTLSGGSVAVRDGPSGNNSVSAAGDTAASKGKTLYYFAGKGNDSFSGGFENDTVYAGSGTDTVTAGSGNETIFAGTGLSTFTAGSGADKFVFMADNLPTQTLDNFRASADDLVVWGVSVANGFDLGSTDNGLNPLVPEAIDPSIFIANASGSFTSSGQRFAYDTTNGHLFYSATGSNASESVVATLTGAPGLTAGNILFQH